MVQLSFGGVVQSLFGSGQTGFGEASGPCEVPPNPELLRRRLFALGLDADELARSDPRLFAELTTKCLGCTSPAQCAHDLAIARDLLELASVEWRDYCCNAGRLRILAALNACRDIRSQPDDVAPRH